MKITIVGEGAWGKALGQVQRKAGHDVAFWSRSNPVLPAQSDAFILAVPAQAMQAVVSQLKDGLKHSVLISTAKGLEQKSGMTMWEIIQHTVTDAEVYALSGPSFAADVISGKPTAVTLAGPSLKKAAYWANELSIPTFRIYPNADIAGVEIGGATKNVLAIACGISDGQDLGESARAGLITRGFAELSRYARGFRAKPQTLVGLSGLGDLLLTCSSLKSRNYSFGLAIGQGHTPSEALAASTGVVEGAFTAGIIAKIAARHKIDMPIVTAVAAVVDGGSKPGDEIKKLLGRPVRPEHE